MGPVGARPALSFRETLQRHLEDGGLALVATHHDFAATPARIVRMGA